MMYSHIKQTNKLFTAIRLTIVLSVLTFFGLGQPTVNAAEAAYIPASAGTVKTAGGALNIRSSPSTSSTVVGSLKNGSLISLVEKSGSFYKVLYSSGQIGYCHADYISIVTESRPAYVSTQSTALNVRSGPSTSYPIIGSLTKGSHIIVLSAQNGFCKILYAGTKTGYASASYITAGNANMLAGTGSSSENYIAGSGKVSLSVPDYKQYDGRWASVKLGASSKTILQAGCLTTSIAMERSFYYGKTITPAAVASSERYTSGGSIYWPSEYGFIYDGSYLVQIKELLSQGKPVIIGAKTKAGSQHWVIVTGYTPNGSITADDFTINDPGSDTRTTLSSYFSAYPIFYKAAYRR